MAPETQRHSTVFGALWAGMIDRLSASPATIDPDDLRRLDGQTALITGASRGLGRAIARRLGQLGARLILPCRSLGEETGAALRAETGAEVVILPVDLADVRSVDALADTLRDRGEQLDLVVLNAGMVPSSSRQSEAGLDLMLHVNFLANAQLASRLLEDGVLAPRPGRPQPRLVIVGSEAHRSAGPIDPTRLDKPETYGTGGVLAKYGESKLHLHTWAVELSRRLRAPDGTPTVGVHHLCPGAVASEIAREAPVWLGRLVKPLMRATFQSPEQASAPVAWLCAHPGLDGTTGTYLHLLTPKPPSAFALDPASGAALWEATHPLLARLRARES
jgi:NAD(P)-dependent dehydrogenase (short-subunit alcohol dehydrogenase family)